MNFPSAVVTAPLDFAVTEAPSSALPEASLTVPLTVPCCVVALKVLNQKQINQNFLFFKRNFDLKNGFSIKPFL